MTSATEPQSEYFVLYAAPDGPWVLGYLLDALHAAGVRCLRPMDFAGTSLRSTEAEQAVRCSRHTILVLSPAYLGGRFTAILDLFTACYGPDPTSWPLLILLLQPVAIPKPLHSCRVVDATDASRWSHAIEALATLAGQGPPPPAPAPACPYPPLTERAALDPRFFQGRDAEINKILDHLRAHRFLCIIGPSGAGKSALLQAGLLPHLLSGEAWPSGYWLVRTMRPGDQVLENFATALQHDPEQPYAAVVHLLAKNPPAQQVLLLIDQFEEVFRGGRDSLREKFFALLNLLRMNSHCAIIIAMQADAYPDLLSCELWPLDAAERLDLAAPRGPVLRQVVERPAADLGVYFDTGLLERLLADATDLPARLALLQHTLYLLWPALQRRLLPLAAYEQLLAGGRTLQHIALASRAEALMAGLSPPQQATARRILLRLISYGTAGSVGRRQQTLAELRTAGEDSAVFDATVDQLVRGRLISLQHDDEGDARMVSLTDKALLLAWLPLREWMGQWQGAEEQRRRLEDAAATWRRLGRRWGGLLDDTELTEAEKWLASPAPEVLGRSPDVLALVAASRQALNQAQQRDLERAQARQNEVARLEAAERVLERIRAAMIEVPAAATNPPPTRPLIDANAELDNGQTRKSLSNVLLNAFPTEIDLAKMVRYQLNENLFSIAGRTTLAEQVFFLIEWAGSRGRLPDLVAAACRENPDNLSLRVFATKLGLLEHPSA